MRVFLIALICLAACGPAERSDAGTITGGPECDACMIRLVRVATLRGNEPVGSPRFPGLRGPTG